MRPLTAAALCALSLLAAGAPAAGARAAAVPDSMWQQYPQHPSAGATAADREGGDRTLAVVGALSGAALLGCALAGVLLARRRPAAAPAEATSPPPPPPARETTTVWARPAPVQTPESPPLPAAAAPERPARPAGRHDQVYDAVYQRELQRIARKRERFRRIEQGRNGRSPRGPV